MNNVPLLRFDGFSNGWEQYNFSKVAQRQSVTMLSDNNNPCVEYEDVVAGEGILNKDIYKKKANKSGIRFTPMDVLYGKLRPYLHNWLNPVFSGVAVGDWWVLRPININKGFLYRLIQTAKYDEVANQSSGTKMPRADWKLVSNTKFHVPASIDEQAKIAEIFDILDDYIVLCQQKCNAYTKIKHYFMQNMFPVRGENVPKIRLAGYTKVWNQRTLGELYTERNERGNDSLQILSVSIHSGISDGQLDDEELGKTVRRSEDKSTYKHVYPGDLIFNMMRAWQGAIGTTRSEGMISPAYISAIPSEEVYPYFMNYLLRRKEAISQINDLSYGITDFRKRLYWDSFIRVKCMLPSIDEQKAITDFFEIFDSYITLQTQKIIALKAVKKYLLQNMFV